MQDNELVKRQPVNYRYDALNWEFIKLLAEIAKYSGDKYGSPEQYAAARLTGEKSPINHIYEHLRAYQVGELHDHFETMKHQLAAIAYNAAMEALYLEKFGYELGVIPKAARPNLPVNIGNAATALQPITWEADEQGARQEVLELSEILGESPFTPLNQPGGVERLTQILKEAQERANGEV